MAAVHAEIEDKFDVDEAFALPDLRGIDGVVSVGEPVQHELEAMYFDTADLRLIGSRITLRRRTGGTDAGWHLKLPGDGRTRTEVRRPLGRSVRTVPAPLQEQVRAYVRDSSLGPMVRIRTTRTVRELFDAERTVIAEVADDSVASEVLGRTAEIRHWREIEVELRSGGTAVLDAAAKVLTAAGARPAAARSKLARALGDRLTTRASIQPADSSSAGALVLAYLREHAARFQRLDPAVRTDQPDAVHQMRVSARRLRSALKAYRPVFEAEPVDRLRAELQWFGALLSPARDAEVQLARFGTALHGLPPELVLGPVAARLDGEYRGRYQRSLAGLRTAMNQERYFRLLDALDDLTTRPPFTGTAAKSAMKFATRRTDKAFQRALRLIEAAEAPGLDEQTRLGHRHEARKAAKRARYAAEAARPVLKSAKKNAKRLHAIQRSLGQHRDAIIASGELRAHAIHAYTAGENAFTYGLLHAQELHNADAAITGYRRARKRLR